MIRVTSFPFFELAAYSTRDMLLNSKSLPGLPVRTRSGQAVGKAVSADIETDTGRISAIRVRTRGLVPGLMDHELSIAWNQMIEITETEIVVQDGTVPIAGRALASASPAVSSGGASLSVSEGAES